MIRSVRPEMRKNLVHVLLGLPASECRSEEELNALYRVLRDCWQVMPLLASDLPRLLGQFGDHPLANRLKDHALCLEHFARLQHISCLQVAEQLRQADVAFALLKGTALKYTAYDSPLHRIGFDVDIGVGWDDLTRAREAVRQCGFAPASWSWRTRRFYAAPLPRHLAVQYVNYEAGYITRAEIVEDLPDLYAAYSREKTHLPPGTFADRDGKIIAYCTLDIHHGVLPNTSVASFLKTATCHAEFNNLTVPSKSNMLFHLLAKLCIEIPAISFPAALYQAVDFKRICETIAQPDIDKAIQLLHQNGFSHSARVVVNAFCSLLENPAAHYGESSAGNPAKFNAAAIEEASCDKLVSRLWGDE